ncbi:hypothetical protein ITJ86_15270 [Winogradskyella sp. F6397]|uniref:Outer membrane protein beta-barrel domain-containing protein n=1 Tax=Winogradskyella marina TaxID=2785530 RepID=A0ABS0ELD0_9FLAO|nr:hypothetical protein [Winogradskyella marina]MBF8151268.1 hypothetical protein [Winogradskyella marina]
MTLRLLINTSLVISLLLCASVGFAQDNLNESESQSESSSTFFDSEDRQRFFAMTIGGHKPFTSGDNFMGEGLRGKSGIDFKVQMYVYKHFFIGLATGSSYFDVKNQELLGSYRTSRIAENYVYLGYEFLPAENFRLGLNIAVDGDLNYKNSGFSTSDIAEQHDSARLNRYGLYLHYELAKHFMIYFDYAYNVSKTNIDAPSQLEDFFRKGKYSTIGIGLVFTIGSRDLISRFLN